MILIPVIILIAIILMMKSMMLILMMMTLITIIITIKNKIIIFKQCESLSLKSPDVNQFIFSFVIFMVFVYNAVPILLNKRFRTQQRCTNEMIK